MKYSYAIYFEDSKLIKVYPNELHNTDYRAKLRGCDLFDESNQFKLYIRYREECPHFYSIGRNRKNFTSEKDSEKHNEVITILQKFLSNRERINVCYYDWENYDKDKNKKPDLISLIKLKSYVWECEVKQVISKDGFVKADIAGRSKSLELTDKNPIIIIEVVHTHFLTFEAFDRYRLISEDISIIIIFYFIQGKGKYNHMRSSKKSLDLGYLRISNYIIDGSFWIQDERFEEHYSNIKKCNLSDRIDYYNAVKEFKIRDILNEQKNL